LLEPLQKLIYNLFVLFYPMSLIPYFLLDLLLPFVLSLLIHVLGTSVFLLLLTKENEIKFNIFYDNANFDNQHILNIYKKSINLGNNKEIMCFRILRVKFCIFSFFILNFFNNYFRYDENKYSIKRNIIINMGGPLFSFISCLFFLFIILKGQIPDLEGNYPYRGNYYDKYLSWYILTFFLSFFFLRKSLNPSPTLINPGFKILEFKKFNKTGFSEYLTLNKIISLMDEEKFDEIMEQVGILEKKELEMFTKDEFDSFRIIIYIIVGNFDMALTILNKKIENGEKNIDNFLNSSVCHIRLGNHEKAILECNQALLIEPDDLNALNIKAYASICLNQYKDSINLSNRIINLDDKNVGGYENRGLASIKKGDINEGLNDLNFALKLNENSADLFRNFGIYYLELEDYKKALEFFEKAYTLNKYIFEIDYYLELTKRKINNENNIF
jgi:tetratricopeptide (TPR) repeat protein